MNMEIYCQINVAEYRVYECILHTEKLSCQGLKMGMILGLKLDLKIAEK